MVFWLIRAIGAFLQYHRHVDELSRMEDRELHDLGIARSNISEVAAGHYKGWLHSE